MVEVVWWLLIISLPIAARVAFLLPPVRRLARRTGERLRDRITECFDRPEHMDELTAELWRAARREQLRRDLWRLQRIVLTDAWMSATRQIGNRLAYAWVRAELDRYPDLPPYRPSAAPLNGPAPALAGTAPTHGSSTVTWSTGGSQVEVLELGWRRRRELPRR